MNLLLDTRAALWFFWDDPQLSAHAKGLIVDPNNRKCFSIARCWEVATGKLQLGEPARTFLPREISRNNFNLLPIWIEHATGVESLPLHHRDPFDRLLIVQAMIEQLSIVSIDPEFDAYPVTRLW